MRHLFLTHLMLTFSSSAFATSSEWIDFLGCYDVVSVDGRPTNHTFEAKLGNAFYLFDEDGGEIPSIQFWIPKNDHKIHIHEIFVNKGAFTQVGDYLVHNVKASNLLYRPQPSAVRFSYQSVTYLRKVDATTTVLTYSDHSSSIPSGLMISDDAQVVLNKISCN